MTIDKIQIFDGAQGTVLADARDPEHKHQGVAALNITNPARVQQMHRDYLDAGAQYITCNSFELNPAKWQSQEYTWQEIADAAIQNARTAVGTRAKVMFDVSTSGQLMEPVGPFTFEQAYDNFRQVAEYTHDRVDGYLLETFSDLYELRAAILAIRDVCSNPIFATMTFDEQARTLTGSTPEIVEAADGFVVKNRFRHPKTMRAVRESGLPVRMIPVADRQAQYDYIFSRREAWGDETAILFRNNDIALPLIDRFEQEGIPYRCRNYEDSFFTHRIVRDIVDTICFASAPDNAELFLRLYYKFGAGISGNPQRYAFVSRVLGGKDENDCGKAIRQLLSRIDMKKASVCRCTQALIHRMDNVSR